MISKKLGRSGLIAQDEAKRQAGGDSLANGSAAAERAARIRKNSVQKAAGWHNAHARYALAASIENPMYSLIIPVYGNEGSLPEVISTVTEMAGKLADRMEVVFV